MQTGVLFISIVIANHSLVLIKVLKYFFLELRTMIVIILLNMDVIHEYDEYYLVYEEESLLFLVGLYSCSCQKINKKYKKYKPTMLYSDRLYLSSSKF